MNECVIPVYGGGLTFDVCLVSLHIKRILPGRHVPQGFDIMRIADCYRIGRFGECAHQFAAVGLGLVGAVHTHVHQVNGVVEFQPIGSFRVAFLKVEERSDREGKIFQLFVDDYPHVVYSVFDQPVAIVYFFLRAGNLGQVIFFIVRIACFFAVDFCVCILILRIAVISGVVCGVVLGSFGFSCSRVVGIFGRGCFCVCRIVSPTDR